VSQEPEALDTRDNRLAENSQEGRGVVQAAGSLGLTDEKFTIVLLIIRKSSDRTVTWKSTELSI
jgi:tRNA(Ile2) C34 agmatinyltransferase TiaS